MGGFFAGVLAAAGMVTSGVAATAAIRSADALPVVALAAGPAAAGKCMVRVLRTGAPGTADIVREQLAGGGCVCVVTSGPASANGPAENVISGLFRNRDCSNAPTVNNNAAAPANNVAPAAQAASASAGSGILPVVAGVAAAGGLATALGSISNG